jgi:hypothetical protein
VSVLKSFLVGGALVGGGLLVFKYRKKLGLGATRQTPRFPQLPGAAEAWCQMVGREVRVGDSERKIPTRPLAKSTSGRYRVVHTACRTYWVKDGSIIAITKTLKAPGSVPSSVGKRLRASVKKAGFGDRLRRLDLPTDDHIERMTRDAERFAVVNGKFQENLRDGICIAAHRRIQDMLQLGGRIEAHAKSVGLPAELEPFLEKLSDNVATAHDLFDEVCRVSRKERGRRVPPARRRVRTGV